MAGGKGCCYGRAAMADQDPSPPSKQPSLTEAGRAAAAERERRRAAALRENLKRRKAWTRGVAAAEKDTP